MNRLTVIVAALPLVLASLASTAADDPSDNAEEAPEDVKELMKAATELSEPGLCYRALAISPFELTKGMVIEVCGGSVDGKKTAACFVDAYMPEEAGGLGLSQGMAADLCRVAGKRPS